MKVFDYRYLAPTKENFETVKSCLGKEITFYLYLQDVSKNKMQYKKVSGIVKKVVYDDFGYHLLWALYDDKLYLVCKITDEIENEIFWMCTWVDIKATKSGKDISKVLNDGSLLSIKI